MAETAVAGRFPSPPALERGLPDPPAWLPPEVAAMWEVLRRKWMS